MLLEPPQLSGSIKFLFIYIFIWVKTPMAGERHDGLRDYIIGATTARHRL